jgi:hypothetical protein
MQDFYNRCKTFFRIFSARKPTNAASVLLRRTGTLDIYLLISLAARKTKALPRATTRGRVADGTARLLPSRRPFPLLSASSVKKKVASRRHGGRGKLHRPASPPPPEVLDCFQVGDLSRRSGRHPSKIMLPAATNRIALIPCQVKSDKNNLKFFLHLRLLLEIICGLSSNVGIKLGTSSN